MVSRANLSEDSLAKYHIPLTQWKAADLAALAAAGVEDSGDHFLDEDTNVLILKGNEPNADTQTDVSWTQVGLPVEYVSGGTLEFVVVADKASAASGTSTIDLEVYEQTTGTVGSDLCATGAQTVVGALAMNTLTFTITSTGLEPGSLLNLKLTSAVTDDNTTGQIRIYATYLQMDVRG